MFSESILTWMLLHLYISCSYANSNGFRQNYVNISQTDNYYKFHMQPLSWFEAKRTCASEGASLFYPENVEEANLVLEYLKRTVEQFPAEVFIGVSDLVARGVFETIDGRPITAVYNKWAPGEPNGFVDGEDCVVIVTANGYLNDLRCAWEKSYICKKHYSEWNDLCDNPDKSYGYNAKTGKCYKFHNTPMTWPQAHVMCTDEQSYLAIINNAHEAEELVKITNAATADKNNSNFLTDTVLLGLHDRFKEGWTTIKGQSLEKTGYSSWGQQPSDGVVEKQCGAMYFDGLLKSVECDRQALFICEHDVAVILSKD